MLSFHGEYIVTLITSRVLTTLENLEISGNLLILEKSGKTQGIYSLLREFIMCA